MRSDPLNTAAKDAGFSLVETVMALLIFSLIAAILLPSALTSTQRADADRVAVETDLRRHRMLTAHVLGIADYGDDVIMSSETSEETQLVLQTIRVAQSDVIAKQIQQAAP